MKSPKVVAKDNYLNVVANWPDQALKKSLDWHDAVRRYRDRKPFDPEVIKAYRAGYMHGWRECLNTLKLHGYLIMKG